MKKLILLLFVPLVFACGDSDKPDTKNDSVKSDARKVANLSEESSNLKSYNKINNLNLLTESEWILISEKSILGLNDVPLNYHLSKIFNKNGEGFEMISSNLNFSYPNKESFKYSLNKNKLIIIQNDGYILNEKIRYIDSTKLVTYIEKFDNERTYVPIKVKEPILIEKIINDNMFCETIRAIAFELKSNPFKYAYPVNVLDNIYVFDEIQKYLNQKFYGGFPKYYELPSNAVKPFIIASLNFSDSNNIIFDRSNRGDKIIKCDLLDKSIYQDELKFIFIYSLRSNSRKRMKERYPNMSTVIDL